MRADETLGSRFTPSLVGLGGPPREGACGGWGLPDTGGTDQEGESGTTEGQFSRLLGFVSSRGYLGLNPKSKSGHDVATLLCGRTLVGFYEGFPSNHKIRCDVDAPRPNTDRPQITIQVTAILFRTLEHSPISSTLKSGAWESVSFAVCFALRGSRDCSVWLVVIRLSSSPERELLSVEEHNSST